MEHVRQSGELLKQPVAWRAVGMGAGDCRWPWGIGLRRNIRKCCDVLEREDVERACVVIHFSILICLGCQFDILLRVN